MTESEWHTATDPQPMLEYTRGTISDRRLRLFTTACCRGVQQFLSPIAVVTLGVVERYADGIESDDDLLVAEEVVWLVVESSDAEAVWLAANRDAWFGAIEASVAAAGREVVLGWPGRNDQLEVEYKRERTEQTALLRCVFGNPFRPVAFTDSWRSETAVALAAGIYADRAFDRLPILADALEEAGCDHPDVLTHCRGSGPHARGCWVVDGVLGKTWPGERRDVSPPVRFITGGLTSRRSPPFSPPVGYNSPTPTGPPVA